MEHARDERERSECFLGVVMNEKEATEIVDSVEPPRTGTALMSMAYWNAKGYLEALSKAKGLEEFVQQVDCHCKVLDVYPEVKTACKRCEALAKWEKEK